MAGAEKSAGSPGAETVPGADQVWPPSVEYDSRATSLFRPNRPSLHTSTISFVAPAPVGAPFAMSTLGMGIRSVLAPAGPSMMQRPVIGSVLKQPVFICMKSAGRPQVAPPSDYFTTAAHPVSPVPGKWAQNAYATPWLSVRTVHP